MSTGNQAKRRAQNRAWYQRNREKQLEKHRLWRQQNPERMRALNAQWYSENREKALSARAKYRAAHREELRQLIRAWYWTNRDRVLAHQRLQATGCSPEQYRELYAAQRGRCAICRRLAGHRKLYVDHCHVQNVVRGLLCHGCNTAIGLMGDSPVVLRAAADYLARGESKGSS